MFSTYADTPRMGGYVWSYSALARRVFSLCMPVLEAEHRRVQRSGTFQSSQWSYANRANNLTQITQFAEFKVSYRCLCNLFDCRIRILAMIPNWAAYIAQRRAQWYPKRYAAISTSTLFSSHFLFEWNKHVYTNFIFPLVCGVSRITCNLCCNWWLSMLMIRQLSGEVGLWYARCSGQECCKHVRASAKCCAAQSCWKKSNLKGSNFSIHNHIYF